MAPVWHPKVAIMESLPRLSFTKPLVAAEYLEPDGDDMAFAREQAAKIPPCEELKHLGAWLRTYCDDLAEGAHHAARAIRRLRALNRVCVERETEPLATLRAAAAVPTPMTADDVHPLIAAGIYSPDAPRCAACGNPYSKQEADAGMTTCEHCPPGGAVEADEDEYEPPECTDPECGCRLATPYPCDVTQ